MRFLCALTEENLRGAESRDLCLYMACLVPEWMLLNSGRIYSMRKIVISPHFSFRGSSMKHSRASVVCLTYGIYYRIYRIYFIIIYLFQLIWSKLLLIFTIPTSTTRYDIRGRNSDILEIRVRNRVRVAKYLLAESRVSPERPFPAVPESRVSPEWPEA